MTEHQPDRRLLLLSNNSTVTFPAVEQHRPLASSKLYYLVKETCIWTKFMPKVDL